MLCSKYYVKKYCEDTAIWLLCMLYGSGSQTVVDVTLVVLEETLMVRDTIEYLKLKKIFTLRVLNTILNV